MRWQDLAPVAALEERIHPDSAWSLDTWWAELAMRPRRHYVVLEVASGGAPSSHGIVIAGYAGLTLAGQSADVMTIAVDPAHRGRGRGRALLTALHEHATRAGAREILLEVRADNTAALGLYAAEGYRTASVRRGYYQPGSVDAIVQRRGLATGTVPAGD
jgi:ribosomal-protein-alanine N-acetyltransferase